MTYQFQNIPNPADLLSVSQSDLKQNAQYFQTALNKDHQIVFGDLANASGAPGTIFEGRHYQVSLTDWSVKASNPPNNTGNPPVFPTDGVDNQIYSYGGDLFTQNSAGKTYGISPCLPIIAAARFNSTGVVQGNKIGNITLVKNSTGNYTVSALTPTTANFLPVITVSSANTAQALAVSVSNLNASGFNFVTYDAIGGALYNATTIFIIVYDSVL